uniref:Uncharacterized protein n=1 Tax=Parascaris equorum TaxID=6256 RepID=A0A914S6F7_PAREQ
MGAAYKDEQLQWKIHTTVQNNHRISLEQEDNEIEAALQVELRHRSK